MKASRLIASLVTALILTSTCAAVDLTKIDRTTIKKEPTYYKNPPQYCLVVLGPEAKTRVWMVRDGDVLYVDRNGNGDLTEKGKQVKGVYVRIDKEDVALVPELAKVRTLEFNIGEILDQDGKTRYTNISVSFLPPLLGGAENAAQVYYNAQGKYFGTGTFGFGYKRKEAPIIHFGGPLTFYLVGSSEALTLVAGAKTKLEVRLGTPGLGEGCPFASVTGRITNKPFDMNLDQCGLRGGIRVPGEVDPKVEIELPSKDAKGRPVKIHTLLSRRDCGSKTFECSVQIPKEACNGVGKAKITVSFPDSKTPLYLNQIMNGEGYTRVFRVRKVVPATFEVPMVVEDCPLLEVEAAAYEVVQKLGALIDIQGKSIAAVDFQKPVTDVQLKELAKDLKKLKNLQSLSFVGSAQLTDEGLKELGKVLKDLKKLRVLSLGDTGITDAGLKELKELKNLQDLSLDVAGVTDEGLKELKKLKNLQQLSLCDTRVTDEGLKELKELKGLRVLVLSRGAKVTKAAIDDLRTSLPKLQILFS